MKKKKELKYLKRLFKKIKKYFKDFTQTQDSEDLHKFRVKVKKLRSFLTLLEVDDKNDKLLENFKPIKKIFKLAGVIRDAHMHQQQAKENNIVLPQFYINQHKVQQESTDKLLQQQHKLLRNIKKVKRKLRHQIHSISVHEMEQFFSEQISNTEQLLKRNDFSEQLHNGRKMLKHLLYNRHIIPDAIIKDMHLNFNAIDAMQQSIGNWHDNKLALDFFNHTMLNIDLAAMKQKQEELKNKISESSN